MNSPEILYGYCACGCGELAPIAKKTKTKDGAVKGLPQRFVHGHRVRLDRKSFSEVVEMFWHNILYADNGCWLWQAGQSLGYGEMRVLGRAVLAHRFSWELHHGTIPKGLYVLHNCPGGDNRACVNPAHLWLGTHLQNIADAKAKKQFLSGENHPLHKRPDRHWSVKHADHIHELMPQGEQAHNARLTNEEAKEIRRLRPSMLLRELADRFGVSISVISNAANWKTYSNI